MDVFASRWECSSPSEALDEVPFGNSAMNVLNVGEGTGVHVLDGNETSCTVMCSKIEETSVPDIKRQY